MSKTIVQFGFKLQKPDLPTIDCRILHNPWRRAVADEELQAEVANDPNFDKVVRSGIILLYQHDVIAIGCLMGRHRSVAVVKEILHRQHHLSIKVKWQWPIKTIIKM